MAVDPWLSDSLRKTSLLDLAAFYLLLWLVFLLLAHFTLEGCLFQERLSSLFLFYRLLLFLAS